MLESPPPGMPQIGTRAVADPEIISTTIYVFVDDVEADQARARPAGAVIRAELHVHFGGNRPYPVSGPGGHRWTSVQPVAQPVTRPAPATAS